MEPPNRELEGVLEGATGTGAPLAPAVLVVVIVVLLPVSALVVVALFPLAFGLALILTLLGLAIVAPSIPPFVRGAAAATFPCLGAPIVLAIAAGFGLGLTFSGALCPWGPFCRNLHEPSGRSCRWHLERAAWGETQALKLDHCVWESLGVRRRGEVEGLWRHTMSKSCPQNHQPCTCPDTYLVGPGNSELFSTMRPKLGSVGPGGSQLFSTWDPNRVRWDAVGPGGSQPLLYVGPYTPFGFYNAN